MWLVLTDSGSAMPPLEAPDDWPDPAVRAREMVDRDRRWTVLGRSLWQSRSSPSLQAYSSRHGRTQERGRLSDLLSRH